MPDDRTDGNVSKPLPSVAARHQSHPRQPQ